MAMSLKFENRFEVASPTTRIGSATMSGSAMCKRDGLSRRKVQRPIRQIGSCNGGERERCDY